MSKEKRTSESDFPPSAKPRRRRLASISLVLSSLLALVLMVLYFTQPDSLVPITMVPTWGWLVPGGLLVLIGCRTTSKLLLLFALASWIVFAWCFVDEARSFTRFKNQPAQLPQDQNKRVRIISLNCNIGLLRCAEEVVPYQPDIVLLQESPGRDQLKELSDQLFGDQGQVVWSPDSAIVFRGQADDVYAPRDSHFVAASFKVDGSSVTVVSTRLSPPVYRLDFWRRSFWKDHLASRRDHRKQLEKIMQYTRKTLQTEALVVGGDFNAVSRDGAFRAFSPDLQDAFLSAGLGWGGTGTNETPLFRVDQIWTNGRLKAQAVTSRKTLHSDHRMVVADFEIISD